MNLDDVPIWTSTYLMYICLAYTLHMYSYIHNNNNKEKYIFPRMATSLGVSRYIPNKKEKRIRSKACFAPSYSTRGSRGWLRGVVVVRGRVFLLAMAIVPLVLASSISVVVRMARVEGSWSPRRSFCWCWASASSPGSRIVVVVRKAIELPRRRRAPHCRRGSYCKRWVFLRCGLRSPSVGLPRRCCGLHSRG
jgi:hypothetical protein